MPNFLDGVYALAWAGAAPYLLWQRWRYGKYRRGWWHKLTGLLPPRTSDRPCVWVHAVSVGEVLLLRPFLSQMQQHYPQWQTVLTVGTETGYDVARATFPQVEVFFAPLDFTWAIHNAFECIRPQLLLLVELELWPNWLREAERRRVPVAVINARLSERSFRGYRWLGRLFARYTRAVRLWATQNTTYATRLQGLGVDPSRILVTGSMKFDGVATQQLPARTQELAKLFGLGVFSGTNQPELIWVAGSTQEPEEEIVLHIYQRLRTRFRQLRLILVPRHRERFDAVAELITRRGWSVLRRSHLASLGADKSGQGNCVQTLPSSSPATLGNGSMQNTSDPPVILVDTLGELAYVWGLADVAFVGGSFGDRGGQNMLEPAALGVPVIFGPNVWNFQEIADQLCRHDAALQVHSPQELEEALVTLLNDPLRRVQLGQRARQFVLAQQGAVSRTLTALQPWLAAPASSSASFQNAA